MILESENEATSWKYSKTPIRYKWRKDSAALALYLRKKHPELDIEYYTCDTGKELQETYDLIDRLESALGKPIEKYISFQEGKTAIDNPFDCIS